MILGHASDSNAASFYLAATLVLINRALSCHGRFATDAIARTASASEGPHGHGVTLSDLWQYVTHVSDSVSSIRLEAKIAGHFGRTSVHLSGLCSTWTAAPAVIVPYLRGYGTMRFLSSETVPRSAVMTALKTQAQDGTFFCASYFWGTVCLDDTVSLQR